MDPAPRSQELIKEEGNEQLCTDFWRAWPWGVGAEVRVLSLGPWHARRAEGMKGDGKRSQGSLGKVRTVLWNQPGWPGRERGLAVGLMGPELGSLGELWVEGGAGFQEDKGSRSLEFGVEEGTPRCDCIWSLALILTLHFIQDGAVTSALKFFPGSL